MRLTAKEEIIQQHNRTLSVTDRTRKEIKGDTEECLYEPT